MSDLSPLAMHDVLISRQLEMAGLPALANVKPTESGTDPYAPPDSAIIQLSGYGQMLGAAVRASEGVSGILNASTNYAASTAPSVVTATAPVGTGTGSYSIQVGQVAQAQIMESTAVFADADANVFGQGSLTITQAGSATTVNVSGASLNSLVAAINGSGAAVTASVVSSSYGYSLKISGLNSGAANSFTISAPSGDPFNQWANYLSQLGMKNSKVAQDAAFTINSVSGTSDKNSGIALSQNATFTIGQTGTADVTITATPPIATDSASVNVAATKLVQQYNALQGTLAQLTGVSGSLSGDSVALQLSNDIYQGTQATYASSTSSLTTLSQLGITAGGAMSPLSLNTATLSNAFNNDAAGTSALLTKWANSMQSLLAGFTGESGSIINQAKTVQEGMAFMNGSAASVYTTIPAHFKQYLLEKSLASVAIPPDLPAITVFT